MAEGDSASGPEKDKLVTEMRELRQEFQEYADTTTQYRISRRVENIQVLIALSVVGGTITLYSSGFLESPIWKNLINTWYWVVILSIFIGANALFLLLKLITIPLLPVWNSGLVRFLHEEVEPFLYFFAVLGAVSAILMGFGSRLFLERLSAIEQVWLAIISLILPGIIAVIYSQMYRISSAVERESIFIMEIDHILNDLARAGAINAEMQAQLMRNILSIMTPSPALLVVLDEIEGLLESIFGISEETSRIFTRMNLFLANFIVYSLSIRTNEILAQTNQSLAEVLVEKQKQDKDLTKKQRTNLRNRIIQLRNKGAHGQLTEEDLRELYEYLEKQKEDETGNDE